LKELRVGKGLQCGVIEEDLLCWWNWDLRYIANLMEKL